MILVTLVRQNGEEKDPSTNRVAKKRCFFSSVTSVMYNH